MTGRHTLLSSVVLGALLVGAVVGPAGGAQTDAPPEPSLTVDLAADGDARVTLVSMYDLENESEHATFDDLNGNDTAREAYEARETAHWRSVANNTSARTGREMAVGNGSLALSRTNDTGVTTFSFTWAGLAAAENGMLTFGEPFASTGSLDRTLVVQFPAQYQVTSVSPGPANSSDGRLVYAPGTELDGLSVAASATTAPNGTPAPSPTATGVGTTTGSGPGFGALAAVVALAAAGLLVGRRG